MGILDYRGEGRRRIRIRIRRRIRRIIIMLVHKMRIRRRSRRMSKFELLEETTATHAPAGKRRA